MKELTKEEVQELGCKFNLYLGSDTQISFIMYHTTMGFLKAMQDDEIKEYDVERFKNAIEFLWQMNRIKMHK